MTLLPSCHYANSAKNTVIHVSGPVVKKPHLAPVRLLHRYSRTHQEHFQIQQKCEVTIEHQETGAIARKTQNKKSQKRDKNEAVVNRLRDLPAWFQEFTKSRRNRSAGNRTHFSHDSDSERPTKVASKKRIFCSLFERPKLRSLLANQNNKGSLQETRTRWLSSTLGRQIW